MKPSQLKESHFQKNSWKAPSIAGILLLLMIVSSFAMQPPRPGELGIYKKDGTFAARKAFAEKLGNYQTSPDLIKRRVAQFEAQGTNGQVGIESFPYATGLPSKGTPKVFVLLIDFPDYPHVNAESVFQSKVFGTGDDRDRPTESLREFYRRSSYYYSKAAGQALDIQGDVLPWYRAKKNRSEYTDAETLIKEALDYFNASRDFSQYDNNGDGKIDFFMTFYAGPDQGWASLWWGWFDRFYDTTYTIDGKKIFSYCFEWESNPVGTEFHPSVVIHETGHGLGLPDYYDYDDCDDTPARIGPDGGLGGFDMMDHNWGDHNAFSKWLLDWISPSVISQMDGIHSIQLRPLSLFPDAVAVMPGAAVANPFSEYFMVQNRSRRELNVSNDFYGPNDGILIYHVNATLTSAHDKFYYDNSYKNLKLLRLMEADGRESIEQRYSIDAGDFYGQNQIFSDYSTPSAKLYNGSATKISVFNIFRLSTRGTLPPPVSTFNVNFAISNERILSIAEAVDNWNLAWTSTGSVLGLGWYGQTATSYYGGSAAKSTPPGAGKYSTMGTYVNGPAPLKFYWRVSSQGNCDYLGFYIDGILQQQISGTVNWTQKIYSIPAGQHSITWKYSKDASGYAGSDCGYVDKVECAGIPLSEAVDYPPLPFSCTADGNWFGQISNYYYGGSAAQSAPIKDGQMSRMYTTVTGPVNVSFQWKCSSEANADALEFWVDNTKKISISGETSWAALNYDILAGTHYFGWVYRKNASGKAGADCGWVDKVNITNLPLSYGVDNSFLPWSTRGDTLFAFTNSTFHNVIDHDSDIAIVPAKKSSYLESGVVGPGTLSYWWKIAGTNAEISFMVDNGYIDWTESNTWSQKTLDIPEGPHILTWRADNTLGTTAATGCVDAVVFTPSSISLPDAVDYFDYPLITYGTVDAAKWTGLFDTTACGFDMAQSGPIGDMQFAFLETMIHGPGLLKFKWKVSSQKDHDDLQFNVDDVPRRAINGEVPWQQEGLIIPAGDHQLQWVYLKDETLASGHDCGWLDQVEIVPLPPLPVALDNAGLSWSSFASSSGGEWVGQTLTQKFGGSAAQSGPLENKQNSQLITIVDGPGTLKFQWKVSCHDFWNYLSVSVGTSTPSRTLNLITWSEKARITKQQDWAEKKIIIPAGTHNIMWKYVKSGTFQGDETLADCGWVDKVEYIRATEANQDWALY